MVWATHRKGGDGRRGDPVMATVAQACGSAQCAPDVGWQ